MENRSFTGVDGKNGLRSSQGVKEFYSQELNIRHDAVVIPKDLKRLRCCLRCHLIKNMDQFVREGVRTVRNWEG